MPAAGNQLAETKETATAPISIRLTEDERIRLERDAQGSGLSAYVRKKLFGEPDARKSPVRMPTSSARQFAHILAALGQSDISANLRELSAAARTGSLPVTPETDEAILTACHAVERMRADLLKALGLREGADQ